MTNLVHRSSVIENIVDMDRYPIHLTDSRVRVELIAQARKEMDAYGCFRISDFIRPEAIDNMRDEAISLHDRTHWSEMSHNPYASSDDLSFPEGHPRRFFQHRQSGFINSDVLPLDSMLNRIYDADAMTHFVWECLGVERPIYRWADPLGCNPYGVMEPGHYFPWHFDGNEFTISILVQKAEQGAFLNMFRISARPVRKITNAFKLFLRVVATACDNLICYPAICNSSRVGFLCTALPKLSATPPVTSRSRLMSMTPIE